MLPISYKTSEARYETTKTQTTDIQIGAERGVLQIRIVESANGHKRDVFAGWSPVFEEGEEDPYSYVFEDHRYCVQAQKSAKKWMGSYVVSEGTFQQIVDTLELDGLLTGDVADKIEQALGFRPKSETPAEKEAREKQEWAIAHMASEQRKADLIANDPMFGMF